MKRFRILICLLLALTIAAGLQSTAFAADRQYTVRISAGEQGTFTDDGSTEKVIKVTHGDRVDFSADMITLKDGSKYYVRGIREAGRDNDLAAASFEVERDIDFVVSYGMLSSVAKYTISYVDGKGKELATSKEFIGNVGDKPVAAYQYIDGYIPRYYNLTATLTEGTNEWSFIYDKIVADVPAPTPIPEPTPVQNGEVVTADSASVDAAAAIIAPEAASQPEEIHDMDAEVPTESEAAPAEPEAAPAEPEKAPAEPEKAPAEPEKAPAEQKGKAPVIIGVSAGVVAIGGLVAWALSRAKKKNLAEKK